MKLHATISADVVASTSLEKDDLVQLTKQIKETLGWLSEKYEGFWGRLVHGDSIECVMDNPNDALRIALLLKAFVKSFVPSKGEDNEKDKTKKKTEGRFRRIGLRLAIGIGRMRIIDRENDIMDGEAIYLSGRALTNMRKKPIDEFQIKVAPDIHYNQSILLLAQHISRRIDEATSRQCETLFYRLQCYDDIDIAEFMKISMAGVNNNLRSIGWNLFEMSVDFFENYKFEEIERSNKHL